MIKIRDQTLSSTIIGSRIMPYNTLEIIMI